MERLSFSKVASAHFLILDGTGYDEQGNELTGKALEEAVRTWEQSRPVHSPSEPVEPPPVEIKLIIRYEPDPATGEESPPQQDKEPPDWTDEINELEAFFAAYPLPSAPVEIAQGQTVHDAKQFIDNHLATVKANNGKPAFRPYLNRLFQLNSKILSNLNISN